MKKTKGRSHIFELLKNYLWSRLKTNRFKDYQNLVTPLTYIMVENHTLYLEQQDELMQDTQEKILPLANPFLESYGLKIVLVPDNQEMDVPPQETLF
jgi:hypothetical protein